MSVRIRLQRHGRKRKPYYHIVVADSRSPRDGKFIERLGSYNPNTNPATIDLDMDKALSWVDKGAQPSDTARAILAYKGVMYKKHLMRGVAKNAFDIEEADKRLAAWLESKAGKIELKISNLDADSQKDARKRLAAEADKAAKRTADLLAKRAAAEAAANPPAEEEEAAAEENEGEESGAEGGNAGGETAENE